MDAKSYERDFIRRGTWIRSYISMVRAPGKGRNYGIMIPGNETTIFEDDRRTPIQVYESLDALLEDGWSSI